MAYSAAGGRNADILERKNPLFKNVSYFLIRNAAYVTKKIYHSVILTCWQGSAASPRKTERDYMRKGNRFFNDSVYVKAEVDYRKALEINLKSTDAMFNLGNSLLMQQKAAGSDGTVVNLLPR